jgi:hypothetical protein
LIRANIHTAWFLALIGLASAPAVPQPHHVPYWEWKRFDNRLSDHKSKQRQLEQLRQLDYKQDKVHRQC